MNEKKTKIYVLTTVECYEEDAKPIITVRPFATEELARKALKEVIKPRVLSRMAEDGEDDPTIECDEGKGYFYVWSNCDGSYADVDIYEEDLITEEYKEETEEE